MRRLHQDVWCERVAPFRGTGASFEGGRAVGVFSLLRPDNARGLRKYRICGGRGKLPRRGYRDSGENREGGELREVTLSTRIWRLVSLGEGSDPGQGEKKGRPCCGEPQVRPSDGGGHKTPRVEDSQDRRGVSSGKRRPHRRGDEGEDSDRKRIRCHRRWWWARSRTESLPPREQ